jgi:hypothetical protein
MSLSIGPLPRFLQLFHKRKKGKKERSGMPATWNAVLFIFFPFRLI